MKAFGTAVAVCGVGLAWLGWVAPDDDWTVIVGGDVSGYLAPCGCAKPMVGGVRRKATAVRTLGSPDRTVYLENGPLSGGTGRQQEIKAETVAEILGQLEVAAVNLGRNDALLGPGIVGAIARFTGDRLVTASLAPSPTLGLPSGLPAGPFWVSGLMSGASGAATALGERALAEATALATIVREARDAEMPGIVLFDGLEEDARRLAATAPDLRLIVYRAEGDPPREPIRIGETWLVTPGEKGKHVLRLRFRGGRFEGYSVVRLGADTRDDPDAKRVYGRYLERVRDERLLARLPRRQTDPFAGNATCGSCHAEAWDIWKGSAHASALKTLEREGHDHDPDCVSCHVVGLDSLQGYVSRPKTPDLTDVGCESCHGPGLAHAERPYEVRMPKVGERSCVPCHVPNHSPGFDFSRYWQLIEH